jgi:uncharacterized membrane protein YbhN (UPF0104 family)
MMRMGALWRRWKWLVKLLLTAAILVGFVRLFARDLPGLWQRPFHPGWLVVSGACYLAGLGFSAVYWRRLLRQVGQRPSWAVVVRAYYLGHLGKYVPGKAWALLLRADLASGPNVKAGYAGLTAFYEVLTTMASGVLLAAVLLAFLLPGTSVLPEWQAFCRLITLQGSEEGLDRGALVLLALCLLLPIAIPLVPPLFNRLSHRLALPFREKDAAPLARLEARVLPQGLLLTAAGWALLGASTWAVLRAYVPDLPWTGAFWGRLTAFMGIAYVAGFVLLLAPGGLGVREFFLILFLVPELVQLLGVPREEARATAVTAVVALRIVWMTAEGLLAAAVFWLPVPRAAAEGGVA